MRIVVTGYIIRRPMGGLAWHYLHYVLGLHQLGHDVYYIEDSEDHPACFDPTLLPSRNDLSVDQNRSPHEYVQKDPSYGLNFIDKIFTRLRIPDKWAYYDAHNLGWVGPAANHIKEICNSSDLLLNVSNSVALRNDLLKIPARALIDTDPVFGQLRHKHLPVWKERASQHTSFLTFGENFGTPDCTIPDDGFPWIGTRQPLVLSQWPQCRAHKQGVFTTVMSWDSYPPGKDEGERYGLKSDAFEPYLVLPSMTGIPVLELAIECSPKIWDMLESRKWKLRDAISATSDAWKYQRYIQSSMGEFTVCKQAYQTTHSGWFSERSAAYLASGRPVVTQESGFSNWMNCEKGVIPFSTFEEAVDGLRKVTRDYRSHCSGARAIAEEYFDALKVLPKLIGDAMEAPSIISADEGYTESQLLHHLREAITQLIPKHDALVLIDDLQLGIAGVVAERKCYPFLEKDGLYWGNPVDDQHAIEEIERLRRGNVNFLVFAKPAFWWLKHYGKFYSYLSGKYRLVQHDENLIIFNIK